MSTWAGAGFDTFGIGLTITDERRLDVIAELCDRGYDDRIVMSHDHAAYLDWLHVSATHTTEDGAESYAHVSEWAVPDVRARGVPEQDITQIAVGTPACILASIGHGGY